MNQYIDMYHNDMTKIPQSNCAQLEGQTDGCVFFVKLWSNIVSTLEIFGILGTKV